VVIEGLAVPIPTLFDDHGAVDPARIEAFVSDLCRRGVDHIFVLGTLGEFPSVDSSERRGILEACHHALRGKVDLWVGCGAPSTRRAVRFAREAQEAGAAVLLAVAPYFLEPTGASIAEYFRKIHESISVPLLAYNIPAHVGYALTPELVHGLAREKVLSGIKDTSGRIESVVGFLEKAPKGFAVLPGDDTLALESVRRGAAGAIMGLANIAPKLCVRLLARARARDWKGAEELQALLERLARVVALGPFPSTDKFLASRLRSVPVGYREPFGPLSASEEKRVLEALAPLEASLRPLV
jgi:4-hydroxy-tetrahydrodipicolinate synthase